MSVTNNRIIFCIFLTFILLWNFSCAGALTTLPSQPANTQSTKLVPQTHREQPSGSPSQSSEHPSSQPVTSPVQQPVQTPSEHVPPTPQPELSQQQSAGQPSVKKPLDVPVNLIPEPQSTSNQPVDNQSDHRFDNDSSGQQALDEAQVLGLINQTRAAKGLGALVRDTYLDELAREHCRDMMAKNVISHDGFDARVDMVRNTMGAHCIGENVAQGYDTSDSLVNAWLNSEGHKENIMNPLFGRTGVGIVGDFATQIFCD